jgi:uncharacterized membrane protein (UPF0127 family)
MLFPIDVAVLHDDWMVLEVHKRMRPFLVTRIYFRAAAVWELSPGTVEHSDAHIGDGVELARIQEPS